MEKIAVVTGTSSGIGFETALALAREGYYTYATMRDTTKGDKIKEISQKENLKIDVLELDVEKEYSVKIAIKQILDQKQRIDILVNNAGWGLWGCVENVSINEYKTQFETNFFSIIRKYKFKKSPISPDEKHLHQLLFFFISKKLKLRNVYLNNLSSCLINFYNLIIFSVGSIYIHHTQYQIMLIIFNVIFYMIVYSRLFSFKYLEAQ